MRHPSWKTPFILSALLLVSGSFAYWLQYSHKPKKERSDSLLKKPIPIAEERQIRTIRIRDAASTLTLVCSSIEAKTCQANATGTWSITEPVNLPADPDHIRDLLSNLNSMSATETVDLSEDSPEKRDQLIEEYGLSQKRREGAGSESIEVTLEDGKRYAAWFGEPHPVGDKQFVGSTEDGKLNEKTVFLIGNFYKNNVLGKTVSWYRDKKLFSFSREGIDSFVLGGSSGKVSGQKKNGLWTVNGLEGDYERIETLLSSLVQARAKEFPASGELKGLKPGLKLSWNGSTGGGSIEILTRTAKGSGVTSYFLKSPLLKEWVEVDGNLNVQLDRSATYLRRNLLLTQGEKIALTGVRIEGKTYPQTLQFSFDGKGWVQKSGEPKVDTGKVRELLDLLAESHSPSITAPAPKVEGDAVILTLGDAQKADKHRFEFYSSKGRKWARITGSSRNEAFELESKLGNAFPFSPDSWKLK
jgi:hypothetical protein